MDRYHVDMGSGPELVELADAGGELRAKVGDREYVLSAAGIGRSGVSLLSETRSFHAHVSGDREQTRVKVRGVSYKASVLSDREWHFRNLGGAGGAGAGAGNVLVAPMPGKVLEICVAPGDEVDAGQAICILEAMKMENELRAAAPCRVSEVLVEAGAAVEGDQELVRFEPSEG